MPNLSNVLETDKLRYGGILELADGSMIIIKNTKIKFFNFFWMEILLGYCMMGGGARDLKVIKLQGHGFISK